ncbi:MAG: 30S ribosomal protein S20 [bacterium]|nr:30S ribosomal protein S20 [bacterium]
MPITTSAKKALRQSKRRQVRNLRQSRSVKDVVKTFRETIVAGKKQEAAKMLPAVYKALDKAAKRGKILKKNAASRMKSRLTKSLARIK